MNLLEGKGGETRRARIVLERSEHPSIVLPVPANADASKLGDGAKVIFGIRPEAVNDKESVDRNAKAVATFDAKVEIIEPAGSDTYVVTRAAGKALTARMRADTPVRVGENHTFAFNLDKAVLFDPLTFRRICIKRTFRACVRDPRPSGGRAPKRYEDLMATPETVDILIIGSAWAGRPLPPASRRPGRGS